MVDRYVLRDDPVTREVAKALHDLTTGIPHKMGQRALRGGDPDCHVIADILLERLRAAGYDVRPVRE